MKFLKILPSIVSKRNLETLTRMLSELEEIITPTQKTRSSRRPTTRKPADAITKELKSMLWDFRRENYQEYLKSDDWKAKRNKVMKMAGYKCRRCGERATQVHHETYERIYNEKLTDLTALCSECHSKIHNAISRNS